MIIFQIIGMTTVIIVITVFVAWLFDDFIPKHSHRHRYEIYAVVRHNVNLGNETTEKVTLHMRCKKCRKHKTVEFLNSGIAIETIQEVE